jgi:LmbE family N-acetylglucosaminyl deacetylase
MRLAGVRELVLLAEEDRRLEDQRLFLNLAAAYGRLEKLVERVRPEAIATLAYEGGHPDHDSCSVLGARMGEQFGVKVWETPLYWRSDAGNLGESESDGSARAESEQSAESTFAEGGRMWATREEQEQRQLPHPSKRALDGAPAQSATARGQDQFPHVSQKKANVGHQAWQILESHGEMRVQRFIYSTGDEAVVEIGEGELERKRAMCAQYESQGDFLRTFDVRREVVRPQTRYEYGLAPHAGRTNYEQWQWWMSARDVSAKFVEFLNSRVA